MRPFSQNLEVLTQRGQVINPKLARNRTKIYISCTNGDRKMKIKNKRNFEAKYFFSRNLEILEKDSNLRIMYIWGAIILVQI